MRVTRTGIKTYNANTILYIYIVSYTAERRLRSEMIYIYISDSLGYFALARSIKEQKKEWETKREKEREEELLKKDKGKKRKEEENRWEEKKI